LRNLLVPTSHKGPEGVRLCVRYANDGRSKNRTAVMTPVSTTPPEILARLQAAWQAPSLPSSHATKPQATVAASPFANPWPVVPGTEHFNPYLPVDADWAWGEEFVPGVHVDIRQPSKLVGLCSPQRRCGGTR